MKIFFFFKFWEMPTLLLKGIFTALNPYNIKEKKNFKICYLSFLLNN